VIKCTERSGVYQAVKRLFDILASLAALAVLSPLFLVIAILILSEDGRPIFYKHTRVGKGGKTFQMYKFRTMYQDRRIVLTPEQQVELQQEFKLENDPRVTRIGSKLRMSSLDELPQLVNILKGDLSIVGPRPERPEIAAQYCEEMPEFALRLQAKAGLTGYAQVYGKYNTTPYDKLKLDLFYIENYSFLLDIKLLFMTVKIFFQKEVSEGVDDNQKNALKDSEDKK